MAFDLVKKAIKDVDKYIQDIQLAIHEKKDIFIHGNFRYSGFLKNNYPLFIILGIFGTVTGYLNMFLKEETMRPLNDTLSGQVPGLNLNLTLANATRTLNESIGGQIYTIPLLNATSRVQILLSTLPSKQADLIIGVVTSLLLFVIVAVVILWEAMVYTESVSGPSGSHFSFVMRLSFVLLFGLLIVVFLSYILRNYGLLIKGLLEIISGSLGVYLIFMLIKKSKDLTAWLIMFLCVDLAVISLKLYVPFIIIFIRVLGIASLILLIFSIPFMIRERITEHIKHM
ncbi:hypothetical protein CUJ83_14925 [Methanocella sp. CWC-04]|uniref:Uncharacterized protein n=1 Tax=Methanooceanicella nereidis TaxID=2052831 RepID=A0AAP2W8L1_9EURY|nr:hypothetical protein [Methanocella sp. CWC-04]MCD1296294.1 hypothetical protein [Methanocella sp. CWC-04]